MTDLAPADARTTGAGPSPTDRNETHGPTFPGLLSLGAAVGLAMMVITSTGDALVAGVLVGLAAADLAAGTVGVLVGIAVVGRWGSSTLAALAGGQAVLGAGGWSGPAGMVVSSWAAAAAVVLVCPRGGAGSASTPEVPAGIVASGLLAAALVAGPAVGRDTGSVVTLRVVASVVAVAVAVLVIRACPRRVARVAGVIAAVSAAALAILA